MSVIEFSLEAKVNGIIAFYKEVETTAEVQGVFDAAEKAVEEAVKEQERL